MKKQKRYLNEAQIIKAIDRAHELETKDVATISTYREEIEHLRRFSDELHPINFRKAQIIIIERRINGRCGRLQKLKEKLAEIRTSPLPGLTDLLADGGVAR